MLVHMNYESFSSRACRSIRILLASRRISIADLAEGTGISLSTLKRRLLGATPFTIDELGLIANFFTVEVAALLNPAQVAEAAAA